MKIGILSTPWIKVPPDGYGGTERVVSYLTEGLVRKGHDVTLFATGDSSTAAHLEYLYKTALGNDLDKKFNVHNIANHVYQFIKNSQTRHFDIIHANAGRMAYYFLDLQKTPFVHTMHGNYTSTIDVMSKFTVGFDWFQQFNHQPHVSISDRQRIDMPGLNYVATVYNSINTSEYAFDEAGAEPISWIGRISKIKGLEILIKTALTMKKYLNISGVIDLGDQEYVDREITPHFNNPLIHHVGPISEPAAKSTFLGASKMLVYPLKWEEPFGIVLVEAMACGTPVVAFARGAAPELVIDGITGYLVNPSDTDIRGNFVIKSTGERGLREAIEKVYSLSSDEYRAMRKSAREHAITQFTIERMVEGYEQAFEKVIEQSRK